MTPREKMARAIEQALRSERMMRDVDVIGGLNHVELAGTADLFKLADAALDALLEPSEAMVQRAWFDHEFSERSVRLGWASMIQAAKEER